MRKNNAAHVALMEKEAKKRKSREKEKEAKE